MHHISSNFPKVHQIKAEVSYVSFANHHFKVTSLSNWCFFFFSPDHRCFCISPNTELHCPGPLVCYLPPSDVQEHSQEGSQEYCCHLGCVVHHHDPSGYSDGVQQPAARTNKQDQPVHSVWWTLGRWVFTNPPQTLENVPNCSLVARAIN